MWSAYDCVDWKYGSILKGCVCLRSLYSFFDDLPTWRITESRTSGVLPQGLTDWMQGDLGELTDSRLQEMKNQRVRMEKWGLADVPYDQAQYEIQKRLLRGRQGLLTRLDPT